MGVIICLGEVLHFCECLFSGQGKAKGMICLYPYSVNIAFSGILTHTRASPQIGNSAQYHAGIHAA